MAVCETCWSRASRDAALLGGSVADHYYRRLSESPADHITQEEVLSRD